MKQKLKLVFNWIKTGRKATYNIHQAETSYFTFARTLLKFLKDGRSLQAGHLQELGIVVVGRSSLFGMVFYVTLLGQGILGIRQERCMRCIKLNHFSKVYLFA